MTLERDDYYEFVALLARAELAQAHAVAAVGKAQRALASCATRLREKYPDFPAEAVQWQWNDRTCEVRPVATNATIDERDRE